MNISLEAGKEKLMVYVAIFLIVLGVYTLTLDNNQGVLLIGLGVGLITTWSQAVNTGKEK